MIEVLIIIKKIKDLRINYYSPGRIWTYDQSINSRALYHWATRELIIIKYYNNNYTLYKNIKLRFLTNYNLNRVIRDFITFKYYKNNFILYKNINSIFFTINKI